MTTPSSRLRHGHLLAEHIDGLYADCPALVEVARNHILIITSVVTGRRAGEIFATLDAAVRAALEEMSATPIECDGQQPKRLGMTDMSGWTTVELTIGKTRLQAEEITVKGEIQAGARMPRDDAERRFTQSAANARRGLQGLPSRLAPVLAGESSADAVRASISGELERIISDMA